MEGREGRLARKTNTARERQRAKACETAIQREVRLVSIRERARQAGESRERGGIRLQRLIAQKC